MEWSVAALAAVYWKRIVCGAALAVALAGSL